VLSSEDSGLGIPHGDALTVQGGSHVALHRVNLLGAPGLRATSSRVTITQSTIRGHSNQGRFNPAASEALIATGSSIGFANSGTYGGGGSFSGSYVSPPATGLVLRNSTVLAAAAVFYGYGFPYLQTSASVDLDAGSWLFHDAATLFSSNVTGATGNLTSVESGSVSGSLSPAGQPCTFQLDAAPGSFGVLAVALPGPAITTPLGTLWLDQSSLTTLVVGVLPLQSTVTLPAWVPRGTALAWQGAVLNQGLLLLSTPLLSTLP